jgi:hypothetical protein
MNTQTDSKETPAPVGVGPSDWLGAPWKNVTSYSQGDKERKPRTWEARFGGLRIVVTRHMDYEKDQWVLRCHDLHLERLLASKDVKEAACQARAMVQAHLEQLLRDLSA